MQVMSGGEYIAKLSKIRLGNQAVMHISPTKMWEEKNRFSLAFLAAVGGELIEGINCIILLKNGYPEAGRAQEIPRVLFRLPLGTTGRGCFQKASFPGRYFTPEN